MKFDFVIGNPPYQEDPELGSTRSLPVYDSFMDVSYSIGDKVILITPARFLFNAGQTKKEWNKNHFYEYLFWRVKISKLQGWIDSFK